MRALGLIVLLSALLSSGRAQELPSGLAGELALPHQTNKGQSLIDPPANETETKLMGDLACVCGTCKREPIRTCGCGLAAKLRGDVKRQLAGADLTTAAGRARAETNVRQRFAEAYGPDVLNPIRTVSGDDRLAAMPLVILGGGLLLFAWQVRRSVRRKRSQPSDRDRNDDVFI
jgi:cytochrome c-type biogenesis protein CcmH/NrfF